MVARESGFNSALVLVDATDILHDTIVQSGETDAAFLQRLVQENQRHFFIDTEGLHWEKPTKCQAPMIYVHYNSMDSTVTQITFSSNLARTVGRVELRGRDPLRKETIRAVSHNATVERDVLADIVEVVDPDRHTTAAQHDNAKASLHPTTANDSAAATAESDGRFVRAESTTLEASVTIVGDPRWQLGSSSPSPAYRPTCPAITTSARQSTLSTTPVIRRTCNSNRDGGSARIGLTAAPQQGKRNEKRPAMAGEEMVEVVDAERRTAKERV